MNGFYICVMVVGIMIVFMAFIWIIIDKKRSIDYKKVIDSKKNDLVEIIEDADIMVEELNKFSDYIVTEFDKREKKLGEYFMNVDVAISEKGVLENEILKNGTDNRVFNKNDVTTKTNTNIKQKNINNTQIKINNEKISVNEKVIHLNTRYKKVLDFKNKGLTQIEIAKQLNIGKGEVKLIFDMLD
ncbi:MAG: hypothetical protein ABF289_06000 [Clostridiales bacterium]